MTRLVVAVVIWSALGVLAALFFRRRGHNFLLFAGLGIWMGPLVVLVMRAVFGQQRSVVRVVRDGQVEAGWLDLLVGLDGSKASVDSVRPVIAKLAPGIRRIRLVTALDPETANSPDFFDTDEALESELEAAAHTLGFDQAELAFVSGRADRALVEHAVDENFDLLLVSARNHRVFGTLLGSAVYRLARQAQVPVLIGPAPVEAKPSLQTRVHQRSMMTRQQVRTIGDMT